MSALRVRISGDSMWPTFPDGTEFELRPLVLNQPSIGDIVLVKHPFHSELQIVKRIHSIENEMVFLVGDNPDPMASDDSHNFGKIHREQILGICIPTE
ncbi:MAG: nickel-type superoxide dismutase maturation protease [Euryarchaeota archaeon]|nr:nickel-type superoxide dismutase maturation protease [Euryarchaeota archaeon]MBT5594007.1 nickel-type superoxide dismutase maturation protease [Euryarchaeota archaeon]MBT6641260.1 nickel-type superoxide dismutase maturation protease [Euryarchaeota archaeon]MBT6844539.1 nickel-type superoxide dismutase maturation protease [Euryarchaeota archaeon]MBT7063631.1 nickel-type superoxide dismutase maturation protease [Euryarchaeota archaeon]